MPWTPRQDELTDESLEAKKWTPQPCHREDMFPKEDFRNEEEGEQDSGIYAKLSVTPAIKRDT